MFKVETIGQYKVLRYLKDEFDLKFINLMLVNRFTIQITDQNNDSALFQFNEDTEKIEVNFDDEFVPY